MAADPHDIDEALQLFVLTRPFTREELVRRRQELLVIWHPHRYANLTNNPRKYMQMYKQAEAMTRDIEAAYRLLLSWLEKRDQQGEDATKPNG